MITIYCDGGCIVGKGIGARSFVEVEDGNMIRLGGAVIRKSDLTNNQAEYAAVIHAATIGCKHITIASDSEVVIKQIKGEYKVKDPILARSHSLVKSLSDGNDFEFINVPRENKYIQIADKLNKLLMDREQLCSPRMSDWSDGDRCR